MRGRFFTFLTFLLVTQDLNKINKKKTEHAFVGAVK